MRFSRSHVVNNNLKWSIHAVFSEGSLFFTETSKFSLMHFLIVAAAVSNHWPESNTEPHIENTVIYQNQEDFSTVDSKEGMMVQTSRMSQAFSEAPENLTVLIETATAEGRNESSSRTLLPSSRTNFTQISPEIATTLTSQGSTLSEFVLRVFISFMYVQCWKIKMSATALLVPGWSGSDL